MEFRRKPGIRAVGPPEDPDYATYGGCQVTYNLGGRNVEEYNRIEFWIYPDCKGLSVVNVDLSFINGCRFGDGFRASSMGLLIWQDGIVGTFDDISSVRVQDNAFENFLYSGYEAFAAMTMPETNKELKARLRDIAEEDFLFASEKFAKDGYDLFTQPYEHTYNTSRSQFLATVSWAASQLYKLTGKEEYAARAAESIEYVRSWNSQTLPRRIPDGVLTTYSRSSETLSPEDIRVERLMLSLRTDKGLEAKELYSLADRAAIASLMDAGALKSYGSRIRIPEDRLFTSDGILRELM